MMRIAFYNKYRISKETN